MLKGLLSSRVQKTTIRTTKTELKVQCDNQYDQFSDVPDVLTMEAGKSYCFPTQGFFFVGGQHVSIAYQKEDGTLSDAVADGYGAIPNTILDERFNSVDVWYMLKSQNEEKIKIKEVSPFLSLIKVQIVVLLMKIIISITLFSKITVK